MPGPISNALYGRCPRCGRGRLFRGYLTVADSCESCGLGFAAHDSADGPAVMIILFFGFVVAGLVLAVEFTYAPPVWVHALVWPPIVIGGSLGLLRPLKGVFIGVQYKYRSVENELSDDGGE